MPDLPSGTVTFLFSDIEGSTRMAAERPDTWPSVLRRHQELLRATFDAHGGVEVSTEGDSFFIAFSSAPSAVAAAVGGQRALGTEPWPEGMVIRVRMGLHTGEAGISAETYVGLHVHRASRIASVAHGGQVLISDATRSLVAQALPDGADFRDLGTHRLKDLEHPERLWQMVIEDLSNEFAPIASLDAIPNNLPSRMTTFLGRESEIDEVEALLARNRLLTLTGPGGTGKTRLSLEVAERGLARHPNGVFLVELGSISEPARVASTITRALNLPDRGGREPEARLVDHVGDKHMLLVLDNFEQVVSAAPLVTRLLGACPNLKILVSSRSVLRVSGEQEYAVPPLGLPDPSHLPSLETLTQYEAVALFIERARAVRPDFAVTNDNAPAVAEICVRLDGLPLAIELAAARIRILTPQAMLGRLEARLSLLSGGSRDLPERQQTLRGAIAWSHDLLDEANRALFACLSVFVTSAGLDAIEHVCRGVMPGELPDTIEILDSLVQQSLVRQSEGINGDPRFSMLETIRVFAIEQAEARGSFEPCRAAHAALFTRFAEDAAAHLMGSDKRRWLNLLEQDHDNLRASFDWAVASGNTSMALRMGAAVWRFWQMRGHLEEGVRRLGGALAMPATAEHARIRADTLSAAAGLAYWQGDTIRSRALYEQEITERKGLGDDGGLAEALYSISFTWSMTDIDDLRSADRAIEAINQALAIFRRIGDEGGVARCEWALANVSTARRDPKTARALALSALEVFERSDDQFMVGWTTYTLALADLADDYQTEGGSPTARANADGWLRRALHIFAAADDVSGFTLVLDAMAVRCSRDGARDRAARLSGAVASLERTSGTGLNMRNRSALSFDPEELRSDTRLGEAWEAGEAMTAAEAVAFAFEE